MAGATLSRILVDTLPLEQAIRGMLTAAADLRPAMAQIGEQLLISHRERWRREESPEGDPWQPLSPAYRRRKPKNKDKLLVLEDHLRGLLRYQVRDDGLAFGTDRIYGAVHQFGSEDVPARPYLGLTPLDEQAAVQVLADHIRTSVGAL